MVKLSSRVERLTPSPIREILDVIERPGMVSFAGGLPSSASFPSLNELDVPATQLQYGASEGDAGLRELIAMQLTERGIDTTADRVLVLSGSQQGIDLVAKLLIDEGTGVAVESPTYLAALQVFSLFGASYHTFSPDAVAAMQALPDLSLVYTIPTFQNPSGHCYGIEQRRALASSADATDAVLFEDDPYRDLVYDECDRTPVCSLLKSAVWVYQSSFSKSLAPGLRLGYLTASESLFPLLVRAKQAADLHTNRVCQHIAQTLLNRPDATSALAQRVDHYRDKRDHFHSLLDQYFGDIAEWQLPVGGLFFWLTLKDTPSLDTRPLLPLAVQQGVAFMPGEPFYADPRSGRGAFRLNFSHATAEQAERGLATLAHIFRTRLQASSSRQAACVR
jgi:DNA-binding transcriptional MocR family regulator